MYPIKFLLDVTFVFIATLACGCGRSEHLCPVTGKVLLSDGTPLAGATISLEALDKKLSATAVTNEQGEFILGTSAPGNGVPAGTYRALVVPHIDFEADAPPLPLFHSKYSRYDTSGLEFNINEQGNHLEIKLNPP